MQIAETIIQFNGGLRTRPQTKRIVLHHSASGLSTTIQDIHWWHKNQGWAGIGYHYVIYPDGTIHRGRPEWARGSHAYQDPQHDANSDGIGICLIGNFQTETPTEAQMESLVWLIRDIRTRFPGVPVIGHKDVMPTACPGKNFPWGELKKRLEGANVADKWKKDLMSDLMAARLVKEYHDPDEPAPKWWIAAVVLNLYSRMFEELKKREGK